MGGTVPLGDGAVGAGGLGPRSTGNLEDGRYGDCRPRGGRQDKGGRYPMITDKSSTSRTDGVHKPGPLFSQPRMSPREVAARL